MFLCNITLSRDGHNKPFCTKAITIIDHFKKALGDRLPIICKSQFFKAISVTDKLSPINFFDKCCDKFSMILTKFFCQSHRKNVFLHFSRKKSSSWIVPWHSIKRKEMFLNCNSTLGTQCIFSIALTH